MKRTKMLPFAAALMLALGAATNARAQAFTDHFDDNFPTSGIGYSECTGEFIYFEGFLHAQGQTTVNKNQYHVEFHSQLYGLGVGLSSGKQYIYQDVYNDTLNIKALPYEETITENFRIIGQGSLEDLMVKAQFHITVNANGVVTADRFKYEVECK